MTTPVCELTRDNIPLLKLHFSELPAEDLRLRFGVPSTAETVDAYVENIPFERDTVFGIYGDDLRLLGVAHLACMDRTAELGLSVLPQERGRGHGTALFNRALMHARNLQIVELFMHCLSENAAILHIARKAGMQIVLEQSEADAYLEVPPGNALSLGQEMMEQHVALLDWALKAHVEHIRALTGNPFCAAPVARSRAPQQRRLRLIKGGACSGGERRRYG